jgi:hypothetical protein
MQNISPDCKKIAGTTHAQQTAKDITLDATETVRVTAGNGTKNVLLCGSENLHKFLFQHTAVCRRHTESSEEQAAGQAAASIG